MLTDQDVKTQGIVLRRTNYGEADRILNIITPEGVMAVMAKGVRKPHSKLAGGVEMFTLANVQVHRGRSEFGILTSAQMVQHYGGILKNYEAMQLAGAILKKVGKLAEVASDREFFEIAKQALAGLNDGTDVVLVEAWSLLNLARVSGEEINLRLDVTGVALAEKKRYDWNVGEGAFEANVAGEYGANEIKLLRLMLVVELLVARRIKVTSEMLEKALKIARIVSRD